MWLGKLLGLHKPPATPKRNGGFFSTDLDQRYGDIPSVAEMLERAIQRKPGEFIRKNADGTVAAMDDSDNFIKPVNDGGDFIGGTQLGWYAMQSFIGYQICAIIAQNWLVDKACTMAARDAIRHGYEITTNDGEEMDADLLDQINERDRYFHIKRHCKDLKRWSNIFGIRIALPIVEYADKDDALAKPFNIDGVLPNTYRGISQIDPYWIFPELDGQAAANPASMHFYEPTWWRVNGRRIHRSHLIICLTGEVADILKPTYLYGGISIPQRIAERVYAGERTANEAPMLSLSKRSTVIHTDLGAALANQQDFDQRMRLWSWFRDNYGIKVAGEEETVEQFDTSLSDFDAMIMTQYQLVAAIAGVPSTKLLGTSPKGFDATGEFEQKSYHEELESIQSDDMEPLLRRHHQLLMKSEFPEQKIKLVIKWNPVSVLTQKEQSEVNLAKAQTDQALVDAGAIDAYDVRQRIIKDKSSDYTGIEDVVPGGPGDREHEQEVQAELLENTSAPDENKPEKKAQLGAG